MECSSCIQTATSTTGRMPTDRSRIPTKSQLDQMIRTLGNEDITMPSMKVANGIAAPL